MTIKNLGCIFMMPIDSFISRLNAFAPYANNLTRACAAKYLNLLDKLKLSKKIAIERKEMEVNPRDLYHFIQSSQRLIKDEIYRSKETTTPLLTLMQEAEDAAIDALLSHPSAEANSLILIYATYKLLDQRKDYWKGGSYIWIDNRPSNMRKKMRELYKQSPQKHSEKALLYFQISDEISTKKAGRDEENYSNFMEYIRNNDSTLYQEVRAPDRNEKLSKLLSAELQPDESWAFSALIEAPLPPVINDDYDPFALVSIIVGGGGAALIAYSCYGLIGLSLLLATAIGAIGALLLCCLLKKCFTSNHPSSFFSSPQQPPEIPQSIPTPAILLY
jgi:hypothetical protein